MLDTIRRYWIALLVMIMIGLHASIVGLIRYQASMAKIDASCEVDLGSYLAYQSGRKAPISMRLYAIVPINHRMKSRQLIELNQAQIRQSVEEHLRQIDGRVLTDPYLSDLKSQLLDVMVQTIGNSSIEDLVITEVHEPKDAANLDFISHGPPRERRQLVATLRSPSSEEESEHNPEDGEHDDAQSETEEHGSSNADSGSSHGADTSHGASKPTAAKASGHGATAKASGGHGTPAKASGGHGAPAPKKSASSSHGSTSSHGAAAKKPAKSSGH